MICERQYLLFWGVFTASFGGDHNGNEWIKMMVWHKQIIIKYKQNKDYAVWKL